MRCKLCFRIESKTPVTKKNVVNLLKDYGFEKLDDTCVTLNGAMFKILDYSFKDGITSIELQRIFRSDIYSALNAWYYSRTSD